MNFQRHVKKDYSGRVGQTADDMKRFCGVRTLASVMSPSTTSLNFCSFNDHLKDTLNDAVQSSSFTPSLSYCGLTDSLLTNGPHVLTLLQLKSLEPYLSEEDVAILQSKDCQFQSGWLYDKIINGYLWQLCKNNSKCLYVASATTKVLLTIKSINNLWKNQKLNSIRYIFIPYNINNHWVLLALDVLNQMLLSLDPSSTIFDESAYVVQTAKEIVKRIAIEKFHFSLEKIESPKRLFQVDSMSCGVFVCLYAHLLANGNDLTAPQQRLKHFRLHIYKTISGNCLKARMDLLACMKCKGFPRNNIIQCTRCKQWWHSKCAGFNNQVKENECQNFLCL